VVFEYSVNASRYISQRRAQAACGLRPHHRFKPTLAFGGQVAQELIDEINLDSAAPDFDSRLNSYPSSIVSCRRRPAKTNSQILTCSSPRGRAEMRKCFSLFFREFSADTWS
jgi:hypothetical protein